MVYILYQTHWQPYLPVNTIYKQTGCYEVPDSFQRGNEEETIERCNSHLITTIHKQISLLFSRCLYLWYLGGLQI